MNTHQWEVIKTDADNILTTYDSAFGTGRFENGGYLVVWDALGWGFVAKNGGELLGWTLRHKYDEWLMVVKVVVEGAQLVGFMSASTTIGCAKKLLDRLEQGSMKFYPDKFA